MKASEKAAQERLKRLGKTHKDPFDVTKRGVQHEPDEGTLKDGLFRRITGMPPKRVS